MVEAALALPVFFAMMWGVVQFGLALHANAGIQQALGEGARFATLCVNPNPTTGCGRHSDADIIARINARRFSSTYGTFGTPTVSAGTTPTGLRFLDLSVTYTVVPSLILVNGPTITFVRTKRVYLAS
jgi:Flp pilus assembly protein TadG